VISDMANEDLPLDFNALAKPDMGLDYGKTDIGDCQVTRKNRRAVEVAEQTRFAAERLAEVLAKLI